MHFHTSAHRLAGAVANILPPGSARSAQQSEIIDKNEIGGVAPGDPAGVSGSEVAAPRQPGKIGRSAAIADSDQTAAAKPHPEQAAHKRFGAKTLDALIEAQAALEATANRVIGALDADGDGGFTLTELKEALPGKSGEAPGRAGRAERLFGKVDADGDGKVTLAELTALFAPKPVEDEPAGPETAAAETTSEVIDQTRTAPSA